MEERVSIISGTKPILLLAPHGANDTNTAELTEKLANQLDCFAVINWGWERADKVDWLKDKANCNNIHHCQEDVVEDEFLIPMKRYVNRCLMNDGECYVFIIHGMGNDIRKITGDPSLDLVIGYGKGKPDKLTCDMSVRNAFFHHVAEAGLTAYAGKAGGRFAGRARANLNQYYRRWENNPSVHSMQVEIIYELRSDDEMLDLTAAALCDAINDTVKYDVGEFTQDVPANEC